MPSENAIHKSNPGLLIHIVFQSHIIQSLFGEWTSCEKAVEDYSTPRPQADARWFNEFRRSQTEHGTLCGSLISALKARCPHRASHPQFLRSQNSRRTGTVRELAGEDA
jgi:hypothetical protein